MNENGLNLGRAEGNKTPRKKHTPSTIQADTLFNFMTKLEYLIWAIKNKRLAPRYCDEDLGYLTIPLPILTGVCNARIKEINTKEEKPKLVLEDESEEKSSICVPCSF